MAIELEGLEFQISGSSTKADKGLKGLHDTLVRIRNAVKGGIGLGAVANQVTKLGDAVDKVDSGKMEKLARACEAIKGIKVSTSIGKGLEKIAEGTDKINVEKLERVCAALKGMDGIRLPRFNVPTISGAATPATDTSAAPVDSGVENVGGQVEEVTNRVGFLHMTIQKLPGVFSRAFSVGTGALRTLGKVASTAGNGVKMLGKAATVLPEKLGSGLAAKIKHTTSSLGKFYESIKRVAMYRLIRSALKAITQGFSEGIKNLYHWSDALGGTFAKSMDKLATDAQYLKNSLAAMAAPLINTEIAEILHYSKQSITAWLSKPLDNKKELAIRNAIAQIVERRRHQVTENSAEATYNLRPCAVPVNAESTVHPVNNIREALLRLVPCTRDVAANILENILSITSTPRLSPPEA